MNVLEQVEEFEKRFLSNWTNVLDMAIGGDFKKSKLRSVLWKLACRLLPMYPDFDSFCGTWIIATDELRAQYELIKATVVVNPYDNEEAFDPLMGNPLEVSNSESKNPWSIYHNDRELLEEIQKDLDRLYPTGCGDFFVQPELSKILSNVLFVWCKLNPSLSYRQGMHELAAPILYTLYREAIPSRKKNVETAGLGKDPRRKMIDQVLKCVLDMSFLEHDLFWIFERVMRDMKPLFVVSRTQMTHKEIQRAKKALLKQRAFGSQTVNESSEIKAPVLVLSEKIQFDILPQVDGYLAEHFNRLGIEPQLYALRWTRLLFGREFDIEQVLTLWDSLLLDSFGFKKRCNDPEASLDVKTEVVDECMKICTGGSQDLRGLPVVAAYFAVAMLTYARSHLLENDYSAVLMSLMKYPQVEDAHVLVHLAFNMRNSLSGADDKLQVLPRVSDKEDTTSQATSKAEVIRDDHHSKADAIRKDPCSTHHLKQTSKDIGANVTHFFRDIGEKIENIFEHSDDSSNSLRPHHSLSPRESSFLAKSVNDDNLQSRMGVKLENIVKEMEDILSDDSNNTNLLQLVAQIKQVRDVLLRRVTEHECFVEEAVFETPDQLSKFVDL